MPFACLQPAGCKPAGLCAAAYFVRAQLCSFAIALLMALALARSPAERNALVLNQQSRLSCPPRPPPPLPFIPFRYAVFSQPGSAASCCPVSYFTI